MPHARVYGGRWEIVRPLVEGGQAHTFVVRDLEGIHTEPLVLKRLKNPRRLGRFEREIKALQRVGSERIPAIVDFEASDRSAYIVTSYGGNDLPTELAIKLLEFHDRLRVFRDIVDGVAAAHKADVTHRDIKPNNVVVDANKRGQVIDFGICQIVDDDLILTTIDEAFGNAAFAAPECFLGSADAIGPKADVYSLGKLMLWLTTDGKHMHRENLTADLVRAIAHPDPWVKSYVALLVYDSVVARRFTDATELLMAVDQIYRGIEPHARPTDQAAHLVWDSMGPDGVGNPSGTRSATTPPFGNPPAKYEVAQGFQFADGTADGHLIEVAILVHRYRPDMGATIRLLASSDSGPDENNVLWSGKPQLSEATSNGAVRILARPDVDIPLQLTQVYWVCLAVDAPESNLAWVAGWDGWHGGRQIFPGAGLRNQLAEREAGQPWRVTEPSGPGMSLRVLAAF